MIYLLVASLGIAGSFFGLRMLNVVSPHFRIYPWWGVVSMYIVVAVMWWRAFNVL